MPRNHPQMINYFNKILKKTASQESRESSEKEYLDFFNFFLDKAVDTIALKQMRQEIIKDPLPAENLKKHLTLLRNYLRIEHHLIRKDPQFIGKTEELRKEIEDNFTEIANHYIFLPLRTKDKSQHQDLVGAHNFFYFLINAFEQIEETKVTATRWSSSIKLEELKITPLESNVQYIHAKRKLKEDIKLFYNELLKNAISTESVDSTIKNTFNEFLEYYAGIVQEKELKYVLPDTTSSGVIITKEKVVKEIRPPAVSTPSPPTTYSTQREIVDFKNALLYLKDGIIIINRLGKILFVNSKTQDIFEASKEELVKSTIYEILPENIGELLKEDFKSTDPLAIKKIVGTKKECQILNNSQAPVDIEVSVSNNYTDEDSYCIVLKNITHKKEIFKTIENARKNAERVAKAKSTFLSNMSHEIRTPLNVILGLTSILKKGNLENDEMMVKNLEGIDFSAKNLLSIVNDILDFSKIEAGKLTIQSLDFNLVELLQNCTDGFTIKAQEKGLELIPKIHDNFPEIVIGDQYRLNQILTNLLGNAIKFTEKGNITIEVKKEDTEVTQEDVTKIQFRISDSGVGIPKDRLNKIFKSFYQVEDDLNASISGTGLGLTITKELIELQQGTLKAESAINEGSVFTFTLPFKRSILKSMRSKTSHNSAEDKKLHGLRVLVAEDNKMNQFYIKQLLTNFKIEVDIANNGLEAVKCYAASHKEYDMIIMDLHMPVMDGLEAIKKIRDLKKHKMRKTPIVACSADVFPESRKNAILAGIDFYLLKPLSEKALKDVLYWLISDEKVQHKKIAYQDLEENASDEATILSTLMKTFDNDTEFIITLLEVFIQETPDDYKSLCACMDREFYARVGALAHKIKSSFMNLGLVSHGRHLKQIELNVTKKENLAEAKKHLELFKSKYSTTLRDVNLLLIKLRTKTTEVHSK